MLRRKTISLWISYLHVYSNKGRGVIKWESQISSRSPIHSKHSQCSTFLFNCAGAIETNRDLFCGLLVTSSLAHSDFGEDERERWLTGRASCSSVHLLWWPSLEPGSLAPLSPIIHPLAPQHGHQKDPSHPLVVAWIFQQPDNIQDLPVSLRSQRRANGGGPSALAMQRGSGGAGRAGGGVVGCGGHCDQRPGPILFEMWTG